MTGKVRLQILCFFFLVKVAWLSIDGKKCMSRALWQKLKTLQYAGYLPDGSRVFHSIRFVSNGSGGKEKITS